jgi:hypothetical protein
LLAVLTGWTFAMRACAGNLGALSNQDAVAGLKAALEKGSGAAVDLLGRPTASSAIARSRSAARFAEKVRKAHARRRYGQVRATSWY